MLLRGLRPSGALHNPDHVMSCCQGEMIGNRQVTGFVHFADDLSVNSVASDSPKVRFEVPLGLRESGAFGALLVHLLEGRGHGVQ